MNQIDETRQQLDTAKGLLNESWGAAREAATPRKRIETMLGAMLETIQGLPHDELMGSVGEVRGIAAAAGRPALEAANILHRAIGTREGAPTNTSFITKEAVRCARDGAATLLGLGEVGDLKGHVNDHGIQEIGALLAEDLISIRSLATTLAERIEAAQHRSKILGNDVFEVTGDMSERYSQACVIEDGGSGAGYLNNAVDHIVQVEKLL